MAASNDVIGPSGALPVVALGASAGGLGPTSTVVHHLGEHPGVAVVVLHHLDPTHESGLVDILARATTMPVTAVVDGVSLERYHVYVLSPNAALLVRKGALQLDLMRMACEELRLPLRRALDVARTSRGATREEVGLHVGDSRRAITIEILPFSVHGAAQRFFLVLFRDVTANEAVPVVPRPDLDAASTSTISDAQQLKLELGSTRQCLESVIEQLEATNEELKAANEEISSSNEELRSTNEELQSAREELQSAREELQATNQELRTVNDELKVRNVEAMRLNDDLVNILDSVEIPIVILGRDARIRRFTPAAARLFGFVATDVDRPVADLSRVVTMIPSLSKVLPEVLSQLTPASCAVQDERQRWHHVAVRPYVTRDGRIDGTVLTALDIDATKRGAERLAEARTYAESIVDTIRESLVVVDRKLRIQSSNTAFQRTFGLAAKDLTGHPLHELGRAELAMPSLRAMVEGLGEGQTVEDFRIERSEDGAEAGVFALNARHIEGTPLVLLALEDVTERVTAAKALERVELGFREVLMEAVEAIVMVDESGTILFANRVATGLFGYAREEMLALSVEQLLPDRLREVHRDHRRDYLASPSSRGMGQGRKVFGRRKDGAELPLEVELNALKRDGRQVVVAFLTDITQRLEDERKIGEYQDRLQRMAFDATLTEERERRRLAVELHDRIGQSLALAQIKLTSARESLVGAAQSSVDEVIDLLHQSAIETRTLTFELSPPVLYDLGLREALGWLAEEVERRYGMKVEIADDETNNALGHETRALVFRSVRELLMNVFKHAKTPGAKVSLRTADGRFEIAVEDAGVGFEQATVDARPAGGFGLLSVREQIQRLGGKLAIATAPGAGTRVSMSLPLVSELGAAPAKGGPA